MIIKREGRCKITTKLGGIAGSLYLRYHKMISSCTLTLRVLFGRTMLFVTTISSSTVTASPAIMIINSQHWSKHTVITAFVTSKALKYIYIFFLISNKKFIEDQGKINTNGYTRCTSLVTPEKSIGQGILEKWYRENGMKLTPTQIMF